MRVAIFSHKPCWRSSASPSGYSTDGGFPFQMQALSELFDRTILVVPCSEGNDSEGLLPLDGRNLSVVPLTPPSGRGLRRKLTLPFWLLRNLRVILREVLRSDAVHTPIPGDIGTIGMLLAFFLRKPLFVRHCGNWFMPKTAAEHFWKWFMERFAGGKQVMLATGGSPDPPSGRNAAVEWIFSTTLTERELRDCLVRRRLCSKEPIRLIIVCRQDREKGTGAVIESLPFVMKSFPQVELDVVGDGPALPEFRRRVDELGIGSRVCFHGKLDHKGVIRLLKRAHLFCYPTAASEGFPKVVLEALACGLPVVTTRVSVLSQLIGTGCGILLESTTAEAIASAVTGALSDAESYSRMSSQAVETAAVYSLERWRDAIGERLRAAWQLEHSNV